MREVQLDQRKIAGAQPPQQIAEWPFDAASRLFAHQHPGSLASRPQSNRSHRIAVGTSKRSSEAMVSFWEPADKLLVSAADPIRVWFVSKIMETAARNRVPEDVLIVEDEPIIALDVEDTLLGFGVKTVRTAGSVAKALEMIVARPPDFALLDVELVCEKSFAIAERLEALAIPFAFVTGYGADVRLPAVFADTPRLPKPYSTTALKVVLKGRSDDGVNCRPAPRALAI
jgi:CheY-like chemotaxis protein